MIRGWLYQLLQACVQAFEDQEARSRLDEFMKENKELSPDGMIRRWVEHRLRETGVVYGTPLAKEELIAHETLGGFAQRQAAFMAIVQIEAELAMEVGCAVNHCTQGHVRTAELLVCFALLCRKMALARKIHELIPTLGAEGDPPRRLLALSRRVGRALPKQAYITGNPLLGLPIHNSFNYSEAKTLGRLAVAYFERGAPYSAAVQRVWEYEDREKVLLLRAMLGLTLADRTPGEGSRRVITRQIKRSGLPRKTRREISRLLRGEVSAMSVAAVVSDDRTRDFLLEQLILGAMLDGHFSEQESVYIGDLAEWLGVSPADLAMREATVVRFYEQHKEYIDAFMVGTAVRSYRQRMPGRLQRAIAENMGLIVSEIKGTGELAELLYRASLGQKLSAGERKKMGKGLVDILRTIPSLAIFTLPGGAVLLPLLFKVLPDGLKPRAFAERDKQGKGKGRRDLI